MVKVIYMSKNIQKSYISTQCVASTTSNYVFSSNTVNVSNRLERRNVYDS